MHLWIGENKKIPSLEVFLDKLPMFIVFRHKKVLVIKEYFGSH